MSRSAPAAIVGLAASLAGLFLIVPFRHSLADILRTKVVGPSLFGRFDAVGCVDMIRNSLVHASLVFFLVSIVFRVLKNRAVLAGRLALVVVAADLALANGWTIVTAPRESLAGTPDIARRIEEAERGQKRSGPFRVHRMTPWHPIGWPRSSESRTFEDVVAWERDTLMPKYGIPLGISYTFAEGTAELFDYEWFFSPLGLPKQMAARLNPRPGETIVWYPRPGFDIWNTRYFLVPAVRAERSSAVRPARS